VLRRLLPLGFEHQLDEKDCDPGLVSKILCDEFDLLLDFAVEGACRLIRRGGFTLPSSSRELLQRLDERRRPGAWVGGRAP
jgi:hypothetical protein